jgi:hypothetical protein
VRTRRRPAGHRRRGRARHIAGHRSRGQTVIGTAIGLDTAAPPDRTYVRCQREGGGQRDLPHPGNCSPSVRARELCGPPSRTFWVRGVCTRKHTRPAPWRADPRRLRGSVGCRPSNNAEPASVRPPMTSSASFSRPLVRSD